MSAVEFIVQEINKLTGLTISMDEPCVVQAKEIEKEQIVTTWNTAHQAGRFEGKGIAEENWKTFESYWEENFK